MKLLLMRCEHLLQAQHLANVLDAASIRCEVRNTTLGGALGDIPWLECAPQLWLKDARDEVIARRVLEELEQAPQGGGWLCAPCNEMLEAQFASCWRCGTPRPG